MPEVALDEANILGVIGLQGALAAYNGEMTRDFEKLPLKKGGGDKDQQYKLEVNVEDAIGGLKKVELVLTPRNLKGAVDVGVSGIDGWYTKQQEHDFQGAEPSRRKSFALNNRASVKVSLDGLASQISKNVIMSEEGVTDFFSTGQDNSQIEDVLSKDLSKQEFLVKVRNFKLAVEPEDIDRLFRRSANANGIVSLQDGVDFLVANTGLDKFEFLKRVQGLGIEVSPKDVDLLFPLIDKSGDGIVSVSEFMKFFSLRKDKKKMTDVARRDSEVNVTEMTQALRKDRIQRKTDLQTSLVEISGRLRTSLLKYMGEEKLNAAMLFQKIDWNDSGSIDRGELTMAIPTLGIDITQEEMNVIWPLFNLDAFGEIKVADWEGFLQGRELNYEFFQDRFVELSGVTPRSIPAPPTSTRSRGPTSTRSNSGKQFTFSPRNGQALNRTHQPTRPARGYMRFGKKGAGARRAVRPMRGAAGGGKQSDGNAARLVGKHGQLLQYDDDDDENDSFVERLRAANAKEGVPLNPGARDGVAQAKMVRRMSMGRSAHNNTGLQIDIDSTLTLGDTAGDVAGDATAGTAKSGKSDGKSGGGFVARLKALERARVSGTNGNQQPTPRKTGGKRGSSKGAKVGGLPALPRLPPGTATLAQAGTLRGYSQGTHEFLRKGGTLGSTAGGCASQGRSANGSTVGQSRGGRSTGKGGTVKRIRRPKKVYYTSFPPPQGKTLREAGPVTRAVLEYLSAVPIAPGNMSLQLPYLREPLATTGYMHGSSDTSRGRGGGGERGAAIQGMAEQAKQLPALTNHILAAANRAIEAGTVRVGADGRLIPVL
jgi:Ca2+-binding EF-hand superfamily protein